MERINDLSGFNLHLEHDDPESVELLGESVVAEVAQTKVVLCSEPTEAVLEGCHYIWVDPEYRGNLSPGQWKAYEVLLTIQQGAVYCVTTIGKLAEAQGLKTALPCSERLANLNSLGAITGFNR